MFAFNPLLNIHKWRDGMVQVSGVNIEEDGERVGGRGHRVLLG